MNAKIARNKSLLKEYTVNGKRTVYLKNGDEFQIQLFNPETTEIAVRITIEDTTLPHDIILMPGERVWLERFTDKQVKFRYQTYTVEAGNKEVERAISHNGDIKIEFFKKKKPTYWKNTSITYNTPCTYYSSPFTADYCTCETTGSVSAVNASCSSEPFDLTLYDAPRGSASHKSLSLEKTKETGRVGEGSYSTQQFQTVTMDFEDWPYTTEFIKVLPESEKPYTSEDLQRIYCTNCGRKLKTKYKYCPYCGEKID